MHVHALSCHAGCFVTAAPLRDGRAKLQTTSTAVDADSRIATRRVTFIACVVSTVMFQAAFVEQSAMFGHSACGTKVNGVCSFSVFFSCVWRGVYAWTLSAAHTEPRQVLWLKRAATTKRGSAIPAAHRASLDAMCWRIGADQWCDGGTGNVVAELPWRVQICCTNEAGRRLLAWAHHSLHRGRFNCVRGAIRYRKLCKTRQNHTHRTHAHVVPLCLSISWVLQCPKFLVALPFFKSASLCTISYGVVSMGQMCCGHAASLFKHTLARMQLLLCGASAALVH